MATFVGTIGSAPASATSATPSLPTGWAAGDLVLIAVLGKYRATTIDTAPAGWTPITGRIQSTNTALAGTDVGSTVAFVFGRIMQAGDAAPTFTGGPTNLPNSWNFIAEAWRPDTGKTFTDAANLAAVPWIKALDDSDIASPQTGPGTFTTQPAAAAGASLTAFAAQPQDAGTAIASASITAPGLSGGTTGIKTYIDNALGGDSAGMSWIWTGWTGTATGDTTGTVTVTGSSNHSGVGAVLWVRETPSGGGGTQYAAAGTAEATSATQGAAGLIVATVTHPAAGVAAATSSTSAAATLRAGAAGTVASTSTASGSTALRTSAAGTAPATSATTGSVGALLPTGGSVAATSGAAASASTRLATGGTVSADSTTVGAAAARMTTAGTSSATSSAQGSASVVGGAVAHPAAGTVAGTSSTRGTAGVRHATSGTVAATSSATAAASAVLKAAGITIAAATASGDVGLLFEFGGTVHIVSTATGAAEVGTERPEPGAPLRIFAAELRIPTALGRIRTPQATGAVSVLRADGRITTQQTSTRLVMPQATGVLV